MGGGEEKGRVDESEIIKKACQRGEREEGRHTSWEVDKEVGRGSKLKKHMKKRGMVETQNL